MERIDFGCVPLKRTKQDSKIYNIVSYLESMKLKSGQKTGTFV